jgi:hypothetical protein
VNHLRAQVTRRDGARGRVADHQRVDGIGHFTHREHRVFSAEIQRQAPVENHGVSSRNDRFHFHTRGLCDVHET